METTEQQQTQGDGVIKINEKQYAMFIHLSQLVSIIIPLVLWLIKKDSSKFIDENGKIVINWFLSALIYGIIGFLLTFILIGTIVLAALSICYLVFIIMGSIKANNGELWSYPLTIKFIK